MLIPLYIQSLNKGSSNLHISVAYFSCLSFVAENRVNNGDRPPVSRVVALFLLSQIFLIMHHKPLMAAIKQLLFTAEEPSSLTSGRPECNQDNITDEEKELRLTEPIPAVPLSMHLETILESLNTMENDYEALFALSLFFALGQNKG